MAVRRVLKRDLKRIAKASGGMSPASCHVPFMLYANNKQIQKTSLMFCVQIHVVKSFLCICNWERHGFQNLENNLDSSESRSP